MIADLVSLGYMGLCCSVANFLAFVRQRHCQAAPVSCAVWDHRVIFRSAKVRLLGVSPKVSWIFSGLEGECLTAPTRSGPGSHFSFKDFTYLFLERGEGREKERETNINVWEKHQLVASCTHPDWGPGPQPRHVPWPRIKPATFLFAGCPTQRSHTGQGGSHFLRKWLEWQ